MADPDAAETTGDTTDDGFLDRRLTLRQPRRGHRAGHDAIILAASTQARAGDRVIDLGAGVGAAGLALATRVPGIDLVLVEIDPTLASLAGFNARTNGIPARVVAADVGAPDGLASAGLADGMADAVLMNPPFHDRARHPPSPDPARQDAHSASEYTARVWIRAAHRLLRSRGILTLIWRADGLPQVLDSLGARFGSLQLQPVHGARGQPATRILMRAVKDARAPLVIHPAVFLDGSDPDVEAAMRGPHRLALGGGSDERRATKIGSR